jgi:hypothetical protein
MITELKKCQGPEWAGRAIEKGMIYYAVFYDNANN